MTDFNAIVNAHAAAQIRATRGATLKAAVDEHMKTVEAEAKGYRGWSVSYDPKPIPIRDCDWTATHPDYDASYEGPEDGWVDNGLKACAATYEDLCDEIDALQDEWDEANGQFGVGA